MNVGPLDFETERDGQTTSWRRAAPMAALIGSPSALTWLVTLPDGDDAHRVALWFDPEALDGNGAHVGACDCRGFEFHGGNGPLRSPCAHLCTVRQAAVTHEPTERGHPVRIAEHVGSDWDETPRETQARADGGHVDPDGGIFADAATADAPNVSHHVDRAMNERRQGRGPRA